VHADRELIGVSGQPGQRQRLDAERQVHHLGRMALGGDQVHHPALGQQQHGPAVAQVVGVGVRPHVLVDRDGQVFQRAHVDFDVEVPGVGQDRAVPHRAHVLGGDHVARPGHGHEHLAERCGLGHRQHAEAAQRRVQGPDRIDLGDDDLGAEATGAFGHAPAAGPEPGHDHGLARQQRVRGPQDAVDGGLPGPAHALDQALGRRVVRRHDRERERALGGHPAQPDHAGGGRLAAALDVFEQVGGPGVQRVDQVAAVVDDQVRAQAQGPLEVAVVAAAVHPGPGEHRDAVVQGQRRRDVVLGGQRVGRGQRHRGAARLQQPHHHRGLRGDVQAGRDGQPLERPLDGEALHEPGHQRHGPFGVPDADVAVGRQTGIGDVRVGASNVSNGSAPACTGRRPERRCSRPGPWSAR
jgi:hypothetical protein